MTDQLARQLKPGAPAAAPPVSGMLQRKCACGTHTPGGSTCANCADRAKGLQRKLSLGSANDPLELEADRAADQVLGRAGSIGINRSPPAIQRAASASAGDQDQVPESVHGVIAGSGRPLDPSVRREMEQGFGHDFSHVRVHQGSAAERSAKDVQARAYTIGRNVVFGQGEFAPHTGEGRQLLAHELTHVIQQTGATTAGAHGVSRGESTGMQRLQRTPAAPTNSSGAADRDLNRMRIDPIADFVASSLTAPRDIHVHISDPSVVHMTWLLFDPNDQMMTGSFSTMPRRTDSTSAVFTLQPSHFSGSGFTAGKYILRCVGLGSNHQPAVFADRDFNVLAADMTTGTAVATTFGNLTYTDYTPTNATAANPRFSVHVTIEFAPIATVNCPQIAWIQAVQALNASGTNRQVNINADQDARKTPLAWSIDRIAAAASPYYGTRLSAAGPLEMRPGLGRFGVGGPTPTAAVLDDTPSSTAPVVYRFEACAVCRTGTSAGQVYGCTTWGYSSDSSGQVTLMPRGFRQMPSDQFEEARAMWNTWRATQPAASQPEAAPALRSP